MDKTQKFQSVDEYLNSLPEDKKGKLKKLREVIISSAPEAEEIISYNMPAYKQNGIIAYFAAAKNHYSLFAYPDSIVAFKEELKHYNLRKGTIRFTYEKSLPVKLVKNIIKYRVKKNLEKKNLVNRKKKV